MSAEIEDHLGYEKYARNGSFSKSLITEQGLVEIEVPRDRDGVFGAEISESLISKVTDNILDEVRTWQCRPLEKIYAIVYFDCLVVKVRQDKRIINKAVYVVLGIDLCGYKDILGLWISENEGSKFWLGNLTEMRNRGIQDMLIACSDNLTGMSDAISAVYPKTDHQLCVVHQIRNSLNYVSYRDRKELAVDLKPISKTIYFYRLLSMKLTVPIFFS